MHTLHIVYKNEIFMYIYEYEYNMNIIWNIQSIYFNI